MYTDMDTDLNRAPPCDPVVCVLPKCFCLEDGCYCSENGTAIPNDLPPKKVPQMIPISNFFFFFFLLIIYF